VTSIAAAPIWSGLITVFLTYLVLTDREDLDSQICKTFAGVRLEENDRDPCRADNGRHLDELSGQHKAYLFSLMRKPKLSPTEIKRIKK